MSASAARLSLLVHERAPVSVILQRSGGQTCVCVCVCAPRGSLGTTLVALAPTAVSLLRFPTRVRFLLGLATSALAFFLFGFQGVRAL